MSLKNIFFFIRYRSSLLYSQTLCKRKIISIKKWLQSTDYKKIAKVRFPFITAYLISIISNPPPTKEKINFDQISFYILQSLKFLICYKTYFFQIFLHINQSQNYEKKVKNFFKS